tara:strand:- start:630 stop:1286 length:657 start_codon:yes stop_codon:yes gene_type:complete
MIKLINKILKRKSICRSLQEIECEKFFLENRSLEIGNNNLNKKSFFNFFKKKNNLQVFFGDTYNFKSKNYFKLDLEKKNSIKKKFENILIFNVLEHVYDVDNAINELKKILNKKGKIYISTPFLYQYHAAPKDYNRYTLDYFQNLSKKHGLKIHYQSTLGTGPFLASYCMLHGLLKKFYPLNIIFVIFSILIDNLAKIFSGNLNKNYTISFFVILKKK